MVTPRNLKHGHTRGVRTPEYMAWTQMKRRCKYLYEYRNRPLCDRWQNSFVNFLADMGPRPSPKHTLERKNNDLGYFPENCCWATRKEQALNRGGQRRTRLVIFQGTSMHIADVATLIGVPVKTIWDRLSRGLSDEDACTAGDRRLRYSTR